MKRSLCLLGLAFFFAFPSSAMISRAARNPNVGSLARMVAPITLMSRANFTWDSALELRSGSKKVTGKMSLRDGGGSLLPFEDQLTKESRKKALKSYPRSLLEPQEKFTHLESGALVCRVGFSLDGKLIYASFSDGTIKLWDTKTGELFHTLGGHPDIIVSVAMSSDYELIFTGSAKSTRVWNAKTGELLHTLEPHLGAYESSALSHNYKLIATQYYHVSIFGLWDATTGKLSRLFTGHFQAFSPNGELIVTRNQPNAEVWNTVTGEFWRRFGDGNGTLITSVNFSPNGKWIMAIFQDCTARLWDVDTGDLLSVFDLVESPSADLGEWPYIYKFAFSPDGRHVVTISGGTPRVWELETGMRLNTFIRQKDNIYSASFSPDGRFIFTTAEYDAKAWDATRAGAPLFTVPGRGLKAFSPDGQHLVVGNQDDKNSILKVWSWSEDQ